MAREDVGGFCIGSDLALQGFAVVDWQPFNYVSSLAGYRAICQDYQDGEGQISFVSMPPYMVRFSASISFGNAICPKGTI